MTKKVTHIFSFFYVLFFAQVTPQEEKAENQAAGGYGYTAMELIW